MNKIDFETIEEKIKTNGTAMLLSGNTEVNRPLIISGVPITWHNDFITHGFNEYCQYHDYFIETLTVLGTEYDNPDYLNENECVDASKLTIACRGQSRGFESETPEWFSLWLCGQEKGQLDCGCQVLYTRLTSRL